MGPCPAPIPAPGPERAAREAGVPLALWGHHGKDCSNLPPLCVFLAQCPGRAAGLMLGPVYFANSAHTAFADMRTTVGWEDFFLLCFCRKCSWLRRGEGLGLQAPAQWAWVGRGLPTPTI